jgi:hypothetical protein
LTSNSIEYTNEDIDIPPIASFFFETKETESLTHVKGGVSSLETMSVFTPILIKFSTWFGKSICAKNTINWRLYHDALQEKNSLKRRSSDLLLAVKGLFEKTVQTILQ